MPTLYEKKGRKYIPVMEDRQWDAWPKGFHIVYCEPGSRSVRFSINPETAGMRAAVMAKEDELRAEWVKRMAMKPTSRPITKKQKAAWEAFAAVMGKDGYVVEYGCMHDIIDAAMDILLKE